MHMPTYDSPESALDARLDAIETRLTDLEAGGGGGGPSSSYDIDSGLDEAASGEVNRVAFLAALTTAVATGARVRIAPGTYDIGRHASNAYCIDLPGDDIIIEGDRGVVLRQPVGMPNAQVSLIRINQRANILIRNVGFDGNWGNDGVTDDSQDGINHTTQADPKNHMIMVRGSTNVSVVDCIITQAYGDGIWIGHSAVGAIQSEDVHIVRTPISMCARNGITFGGPADGVIIRDCEIDDVYSTAVDTEPQTTFYTVRNVVVDGCRLGRWWSDVVIRIPLSIVGAAQNTTHDNSAARGFRITNCLIEGPVLISSAMDVVLTGCRIILDTDTEARSPIYIDHICNDIRILDSYIYDRAGTAGDTHLGAVAVRHYGTVLRPGTVTLRGLRIQSRNGMHGIVIDGSGGRAGDTGTATGVTATTLTDSGKAWVTDAYQGCNVVMGNVTAAIASNTGTVLTLDTGWSTVPAGALTSTPAAGTYTIMALHGSVLVDDCEVDCTDDGHGQGGFGVYLDPGDIGAFDARSQVKLRRVTVRNATTDAVNVKSRNAANPWKFLSLQDIHAVDDQVVHTCTTAVRFATSPAVNITKIVMRNITVDGVTNTLAGVGAASPNLIRWLVNDGNPAVWAGYGTPESAVTAVIGSEFMRRDGSAGIVKYIKNTGTGNTGWVPVGGVVATGSITCIVKASMADTDYITISDGISAPKLYEFDTAGDGVTAGSVQVNISGSTTAADVATLLKTAIEANQPAFSVVRALGVLTLTHKIAGTFANVTITENVANAGFTVTGMSGGIDPAR